MRPSDSPEHDPALERAWRAHSRESPPPELDRAILAAAHRAVSSGPQEASKAIAEATRPQRWWMPLAAAATIGVVAIGILQLTSPEQSLVAPDERVAAVARRGFEEKAPAPAVSQSVDDAKKERDAAAPATRTDIATLEQKKKQEMQPAAPVERESPAATGKLAARAPEPQPFPGATDARKNIGDGIKRDDAGGAAPKAADAIAPAPAVAPQAPPPAVTEERAASRKDAALERQQLGAAADKATAPAQPGRSGSVSDSAVSSFAAAPPPPASARARESGGARDEAPVQSAPAAAPPMVAKTLASTDESRAKARDPDAWIARIRKLRDEGHTAEALRELREFRDLVPDAERRLPADLLSFANSAKP